MGIGSLDHLGAVLLQSQVGVKFNIVPYKGMGPVLTDRQAAHIDAAIVSPRTMQPFAQEGKVKVLAVVRPTAQ